MSDFVVDANVPIVANGQQTNASPACRLTAVEFLEQLLNSARIVVDAAGEIEAEYHRYLQPRGQPGVGDRFYQAVLNSAPERIVRVALQKVDGEFVDFPDDERLVQFDLNDRKYVAAARKTNSSVAVATDSDWLGHREALEDCGVALRFVCGTDRATWFVDLD